jgi:hypothetical protein
MQPILEKLKNDPELDLFYSMEEAERAQYLEAILQLFIHHEVDLKAYCVSITPTSFCSLEPIYEALSDHESIAIGAEQFLVAEFIRVMDGAKLANDVGDYTCCLDDIYIEFEKNKNLYDKVIFYLSALLDHERITIKYRAIQLIHDWIDEDNKSRYSNTIEKIKSDLQHADWKIRWLTYHKLKEYALVDKAELKLSLMDRVRGFMNNPERLLDQ